MLHIKGLVYIKSLEKCGVNGMKNNNRKVISYLARKEYHADRGRRVVLTGAVAFAVMESIGLTKKQLREMLILEGVFYSIIITIFTGIFGSGVFYLVGKQMKERMGYFMVNYPVTEFVICAALLFISCILLVLILYRKYGEGNVALRLRIYAD